MAFEGPSEINELDEIKKDVGNLDAGRDAGSRRRTTLQVGELELRALGSLDAE